MSAIHFALASAVLLALGRILTQIGLVRPGTPPGAGAAISIPALGVAVRRHGAVESFRFHRNGTCS